MINRDNNDINDDIYLEKEFAKIGFDYKSILNSVRYINNWTIHMSAEEVFRYNKSEKEKIYFLFTVIRSGAKYEFVIHQIEATLLTSVPNSNQTKIVVSKRYWNYNEAFPTKEKMCNDIYAMLKHGAEQEGTWAHQIYLN